MLPDPEQVALDLEDARLVLGQIADAQDEKDRAAEQIAGLERELRNAKRRLKEAGWKLSLLLAKARRAQ